MYFCFYLDFQGTQSYMKSESTISISLPVLRWRRLPSGCMVVHFFFWFGLNFPALCLYTCVRVCVVTHFRFTFKKEDVEMITDTYCSLLENGPGPHPLEEQTDGVIITHITWL